MVDYKSQILNNICYTDLVYERINKKLNIEYSKAEIEKMLYEIIEETDIREFQKAGKNIYIKNRNRNIQLTINFNTSRIITADRLNKMRRK